MPRSRFAILLAIPLLAGCAGDDPDNVPLRGDWELSRSIDSITIDGMAFSPEQMPGPIANFAGSEQRCGEPIYNDGDWQRDDLANRTGGMCELTSYSYDADGAEYAGRCTIEENGGSYTPSVRGTSTYDANSTRDVVIMEGTIMIPGDPSPHVLKMIAVQEGTRLGDC